MTVVRTNSAKTDCLEKLSNMLKFDGNFGRNHLFFVLIVRPQTSENMVKVEQCMCRLAKTCYSTRPERTKSSKVTSACARGP